MSGVACLNCRKSSACVPLVSASVSHIRADVRVLVHGHLPRLSCRVLPVEPLERMARQFTECDWSINEPVHECPCKIGVAHRALVHRMRLVLLCAISASCSLSSWRWRPRRLRRMGAHCLLACGVRRLCRLMSESRLSRTAMIAIYL